MYVVNCFGMYVIHYNMHSLLLLLLLIRGDLSILFLRVFLFNLYLLSCTKQRVFSQKEASTSIEGPKEHGVDRLLAPTRWWDELFRSGHVCGKGWDPIPEPMRSHASSSSNGGQLSNQVEALGKELELVKYTKWWVNLTSVLWIIGDLHIS